MTKPRTDKERFPIPHLIELAEKADEHAARIHRAFQFPVSSKDARTILQIIEDNATGVLRAARYDPPSARNRELTDEDRAELATDPEALTPPIRSDPTGEAAIRRKGKDPREQIQHKLEHIIDVYGEIVAILAANMPHKPTAKDLKEAKDLEHANRADFCRHCIKAGHDVPLDDPPFKYTNLALGIEDLPVCSFCKAHIISDCPECGPNPGLPTKAECERQHKIAPKRMSA